MRPETNPSLQLVFGARIRFRDGLSGHLTGICVDSTGRKVTGIGVSEHPNEGQFYVSIDLVTAAFPDCVHTNQRRDSMVSEPGPRGAWLTPDQPVRGTGSDPLGARLQGVVVDRETKRLQTLVISAGHRDSLLSLAADEIIKIPNPGISVRHGATRWTDLPGHRLDSVEQPDVLKTGDRVGISPPRRADAATVDVTECGQVQ